MTEQTEKTGWVAIGEFIGLAWHHPGEAFSIVTAWACGIAALWGFVQLGWEAIEWLRTGAFPNYKFSEWLSSWGFSPLKGGWLGVQKIIDLIGSIPSGFALAFGGAALCSLFYQVAEDSRQRRE